MTYRFPGQLLRAEVRVKDYNRDYETMLATLSHIVQNRPGWLWNGEERQWYFDPMHDGTVPAEVQYTTFSEDDIEFPSDGELDEYFQPVMDEMARLLDGNAQWVYDDGEKGWIFQS